MRYLGLPVTLADADHTAAGQVLLAVLPCGLALWVPAGEVYADDGWTKGRAYVARQASGGWHRGVMLGGTPYLDGRFTYALEAIEAADRAAKEVSRG